MDIYEVYCGEQLIGHLQIRDGLHNYVPVAKTVQRLQHEVFLLREMIEGYPWGKPIPFFAQYIQNNKEVGRETLLYSQNNHFVMRLVSDRTV